MSRDQVSPGLFGFGSGFELAGRTIVYRYRYEILYSISMVGFLDRVKSKESQECGTFEKWRYISWNEKSLERSNNVTATSCSEFRRCFVTPGSENKHPNNAFYVRVRHHQHADIRNRSLGSRMSPRYTEV